VGTIYHHLDTNNKIRSKPDWRVSELKWHTGDCKTPRAHTVEKIAELRRMMSPYAFASQMELNPVPDEDRRFQCGIKHYDGEPAKHWNFVLLCDPAGEGKKLRDHKSDYTAMWVVGRDDHGKEYVVDGVYDRIPLEQRAIAIFGPKGFVRKWNIDEIWYERVGAAADISTLKTVMEQSGLNITIHEYNPGAHGKKQNRIEGALMNRFSEGRMLFPHKLMYQTLDGPTIDLVQVVLKEIAEFPRGAHDDALDGLAQIDVVPAYGRPGMLKAPDAPMYETREEFDRLFHPELETETAGAMELI
jgi:phage terminase large subunit-like protein